MSHLIFLAKNHMHILKISVFLPSKRFPINVAKCDFFKVIFQHCVKFDGIPWYDIYEFQVVMLM